MKKPRIVIKVTALMFKALLALMRGVIANLTANLNFTSPQPPLVSMIAAAAALDAAIEAWGDEGHHGSDADYADLKQKALHGHFLLTQLGEYCMSVVPPNLDYAAQTAILSTTGFSIKNPSTPQGPLQPVTNIHRVLAPDVPITSIRIDWAKPLGLKSPNNVKSYEVYRNTVNNFDTATYLLSVTKTTFMETPGSGTFYYWIVPINSAGRGIVSGVISVTFA